MYIECGKDFRPLSQVIMKLQGTKISFNYLCLLTKSPNEKVRALANFAALLRKLKTVAEICLVCR